MAQPLSIDSVSVAHGSCGTPDGGLQVFVSNGLGPVLFSIDAGITTQSSGLFQSLLPGEYNVWASDSAGFTDTLTVILYGDAVLITAQAQVDPLCHGDNTGQIDVAAGGGTPPYLFSVDSGNMLVNNNVFGGLSAGSYQMVVQDAAFCRDSAIITLNDPLPLILSSASSDANCPASDGTITLSAAGGTGTAQFSIDGGLSFQGGGNFSSLASGLYACQVIDANGCVDSASVFVNSAVSPNIITFNYINPLCNGLNNGSITIIAQGATPLTYSIDGGASFSGSIAFTGLFPGSYDVLAQDGNGCLAGGQVVITEPDLLQSDMLLFNETCLGGDGSIALTTNGGVPPYTYSFDGGATSGASSSVSNIAGGTYDIVVTDNNGCTEALQAALLSGAGPTIVNLSVEAPSCPGASNGAIIIDAVSQAGSISYSVDGGLTTMPSGTFTGLPGGTYFILLEDANGCITSQTVTLSSPVTPFADFSTDVTYGFVPLAVNFTNNSVGAVSYTWSFGPAGASSTQQDPLYTYNSAGTYTVLLIAADGICSDSAFATIQVEGEPGLMVPNIFTPNNDGVNDFFYAQPKGIRTLEGTIYNRYGEIVYHWEGPEGGWDGRTIPAGIPCSDGVYFYVITAIDVNGETIEEKGTVQLVRTGNTRERR